MSESVRRRYVFKLFGNFASGAMTFLYQGIVTRLLGKESYGVFVFVQAHLELVFNSLDLGTSTTFFTQVSQDRRHYQSSAALFSLVMLASAAIGIIYVLAIAVSPVHDQVWPGISPWAMLAGVPLGYAIYLSRAAVRITDAAGVAQKVEIWRVLRAAFAFVAVLILFLLHRSSVVLVLLLTSLSYLSFSAVCTYYGHRKLDGGRLSYSSDELQAAFRRFWEYGRPLFFYGIFSLLSGIFERWLLQYTAGSVQQGFFGIAYQLSLVITLITSALTPIFHRESALAFASGDLDRVRSLFTGTVRRFFTMAACCSVFLAINAKEFLRLIAGPEFAAAWPVVALLALYPIQQASGQLSIAVQLSTNRTREYMLTGMVRDTLGCVLAVVLLTPRTTFPGALGLGATGLALKWLLTQAFNTGLSEYLNCRYLKLGYARLAIEELLVVVSFGVLGWFARSVAVRLPLGEGFAAVTGSVGVSGGLYLIFVGLWALCFPNLLGLDKQRINALRYWLRRPGSVY